MIAYARCCRVTRCARLVMVAIRRRTGTEVFTSHLALLAWRCSPPRLWAGCCCASTPRPRPMLVVSSRWTKLSHPRSDTLLTCKSMAMRTRPTSSSRHKKRSRRSPRTTSLVSFILMCVAFSSSHFIFSC